MVPSADPFEVGPRPDGHLATILVALDGSRFAESVLPQVRPLARALGGRLHLVTVLDPSLAGATAGTSEECRLQMLESERYLEELARGLREEGLRVTVEVREGEPAHEIVAAALERRAGLVAVTARPRRREERLASRGVAQAVIASGAASLMVGRGRRGGTWSERLDAVYRRIAVAVDGSEASHRALRVASALARDQEAELVLVHVFPDGAAATGGGRGDRTRRAGRGGPRRDFPDPSAAGSYLREIGRRLEEPLPAVRTVLCRSRRVAGTVEEAAREAGADLLVLGARGAGETGSRHGRCARELLLHSEVPVLVVQEGGPPQAGPGIGPSTLRKRRPRVHISRRRRLGSPAASGDPTPPNEEPIQT